LIALLVFSAGLFWNMPLELEDEANFKFVEAVLRQKAKREPDKAIWQRLLGDLKQELNQDAEALAAYEKSMALEPANPDTLNNTAWLLITTDDPALLDAAKALELAQKAAMLRPTAGYILDTLAAAYWANNRIDEALDAERTAMELEPNNRAFYRRQMDFYLNNTWPADLEGWTREQ
jgi:Flp pilus assembly protein TadD